MRMWSAWPGACHSQWLSSRCLQLGSSLVSPHFLACLLSQLCPDSPRHAFTCSGSSSRMPLQPLRALRKLCILQALSQCHPPHPTSFSDSLLPPACPSPTLPKPRGFPSTLNLAYLWWLHSAFHGRCWIFVPALD